MTYELIDCPLCGETARVYESRNGKFLAIHGDDPTFRPGSPEYPPFVARRPAAIARMVEPHILVRPGSCPQAWNYSPEVDGEPDAATPD